MLNKDRQTVKKNGLNYVIGTNGKPQRFKPWLGDCFSFLYDYIMRNSIFPHKFDGDMTKHHQILLRKLKDVHGKRVIELATGSGSSINFLDKDNQYTGTDISTGLLKKAVDRFSSAGFKDAEFYVASADDLPFDDGVFDLCLCILSLNFFDHTERVIQEAHRVLTAGSIFLCSVPVPERSKPESTIRGKLYREDELASILQKNGFGFEIVPGRNGALLYFSGVKQ